MLVLEDHTSAQSSALLQPLYQAARGQDGLDMRRPTVTQAESAGRWEMDVDEDAQEMRGVRIYLPNTSTLSRAYYPFPVHLDTANSQKLVMRWLNQMMDAHYTLNSLERIYIKKEYESLAQSVSTTLQQMVSTYQQIGLSLNREKLDLLEKSGLKSLNGHAQNISFTKPIDFVAALSAPQDHSLVRTICAMDQLMALYDKAYLTVGLSQQAYVEGTEQAYRIVNDMLAECLSHARMQTKIWIKEAESLSVQGSI